MNSYLAGRTFPMLNEACTHYLANPGNEWGCVDDAFSISVDDAAIDAGAGTTTTVGAPVDDSSCDASVLAVDALVAEPYLEDATNCAAELCRSGKVLGQVKEITETFVKIDEAADGLVSVLAKLTKAWRTIKPAINAIPKIGQILSLAIEIALQITTALFKILAAVSGKLKYLHTPVVAAYTGVAASHTAVTKAYLPHLSAAEHALEAGKNCTAACEVGGQVLAARAVGNFCAGANVPMQACMNTVAPMNDQLAAWWNSIGQALHNILVQVITPVIDKINDVVDTMNKIGVAILQAFDTVNCCLGSGAVIPQAIGNVVSLAMCPLVGAIKGMFDFFKNVMMGLMNTFLRTIVGMLGDFPVINIDIGFDQTLDFSSVVGSANAQKMQTCGIPTSLSIDLDLVRFNYDVKAEILKYTTETVDDANLATAIQNGIETTCDEAYDAFKKMEWCRLPKQIDACTKIATGTYNFVTADPWTRATTIKGWADSIGLG